MSLAPMEIVEVQSFRTEDGKLHTSREAAEKHDLERAVMRLAGVNASALHDAINRPSSYGEFGAEHLAPIAKSILHLADVIERSR